MQPHTLEGGFSNAAIEAAQAFRQIMGAVARPGHIARVSGAQPPAPMSPAAGAVLLTLADPETPLCLAPSLDTAPVRDWITFHTGAPFAAPEKARFAIGGWSELPLERFPVGTSEFPDRSATLIVECPALVTAGATLRGPGVRETASLSLPEKAAFQTNAEAFPLGLDFIFTAGDRLAALPRTTRVS